jgi:dTDP-4-amino-4,6-dideoxygalactose transaminase
VLTETERATGEILTVPCFPEMTDVEIDRVCVALGQAAAA